MGKKNKKISCPTKCRIRNTEIYIDSLNFSIENGDAIAKAGVTFRLTQDFCRKNIDVLQNKMSITSFLKILSNRI
mgnify:CR=1 FL=1